jgi:UDP-N-acetylglucosamine diphosphorylase/glucosamine-1-phosphate N-acetyltransferase
MDRLTITILAGGEGKRMNSNLPKVLHEVKKKPMLVHIINTARLLNPEQIIVVTGKYNDLIQKTLMKFISVSDILFVVQKTPLGTGDAVKCCLPYYSDEDLVLILNGDTPFISVGIINKLINSSKDASMLVAKFENPNGYGRTFCRRNGDVIKIVEQKDCTEEETKHPIINTGIYCIHSTFLKEFIPKIDNDNAQREYYLTDIVKTMSARFIPICSILLEESENILITGVNTQEELAILNNYES